MGSSPGRPSATRARLAWAAAGALAVAALIAPGVVGVSPTGHDVVLAAPVSNPNACNNVKSGSVDSRVVVQWGKNGISIDWSQLPPPGPGGTLGPIRVCAFTNQGDFGAWDQEPSGTADFFPWSVLSDGKTTLTGDPCITDQSASFRGSVDTSAVKDTVKGNWAYCGAVTTSTTSSQSTESTGTTQ